MSLAMMINCAFLLGVSVYYMATRGLDSLIEWNMRKHWENLVDFEALRKAIRRHAN
jgi:hypothetical protein